MNGLEQAARMEGSYKAAKEAFVSNHSGSGIWEINYITLVAPVSRFPCIHANIIYQTLY